MTVLDSLLEHFNEPLAAPPQPKGAAKDPKLKHSKLHALTDAALRSRLRAESGSKPSERVAAAALLQARKETSAKVMAKSQPKAEPAAAQGVVEALLDHRP